MSDEIILYKYPFRSRAERVEWALNELSLNYNTVVVDVFKGEQLSGAFLNINPQGKVPALVYNNHILLDSMAIIEFLAAQFGGVLALPQGIVQQYQLRQMLNFGLTELEPYLWIHDQDTRLPNYNWPQGTAAEALLRINQALVQLDLIHNNTTYMWGEHFSIADIYFYHLLYWIKGIGVSLPTQLQNYMQRINTRTALPQKLRFK